MAPIPAVALSMRAGHMITVNHLYESTLRSIFRRTSRERSHGTYAIVARIVNIGARSMAMAMPLSHVKYVQYPQQRAYLNVQS